MSKLKQKNPKPNPSLFSLEADNEKNFAGLIRAIRYAGEFVLLFALCDNNALRADIIRRMRGELDGKNIEEMYINIPVENLYRHISDHFTHGDESKQPDILMVYGLESWIPAGNEGENTPFVKNLNAARNHFPRLYNGAMVLWLSSHHLEVIAAGAPDFCSVRSGIYTFSDDSNAGAKYAKLIGNIGFAGVAGLSHDEKIYRASEYSCLLDDLSSQPVNERDPKREHRLLVEAALSFLALAQYDKAESFMRRALAIAEQEYGPGNLDSAADMDNLALLFKEMNRIDEAEQLMCRVLSIYEEIYGPDHSDYATAMSNYAQLLKEKGRINEAEVLMRRVLAIDEAALGNEHPNVARDLNNLAVLLQVTRRGYEAEKLYRRALAIVESTYGPEHIDVARDMHNLATLLYVMNRFDEAKPLMTQSHDICLKCLGPDHPYTRIVASNLASLRSQMSQ